MSTRYDDDAVKYVDVRDDAGLQTLALDWVYREWGAVRTSREEHHARFRAEVAAVSDADRLSASLPCCLMAVIGGEAAGTISIVRDEGLDAPYNEASGMTPWIAAVFVAPQFRGRGLASLMVRQACARLAGDRARQLQADRERADQTRVDQAQVLSAHLEPIRLDHVHLYTAHQQSLYARLGFTPIAEMVEPNELAGDAPGVMVTVMRRPL